MQRGRGRVDVAKAMAQAVVIVGGVGWAFGHMADRLTVPFEVPAVELISAHEWFDASKDACRDMGPVAFPDHEGEAAVRSVEWSAYGAACLALRGERTEASERIKRLPADQRVAASGIMFNAVHPMADAGDELATGTAMEVVVEFWPNHYMALYHAGTARFEKGDHAEALRYLSSFLENYSNEDGWRHRAIEMIEELGGGHC